MYQPAPIDTSRVQLSDSVVELIELLAHNAHEVWSRQRMSEGWSHGPTRDDATKKHPDLVHYGELSEAEKEYDRKMAVETLKVITALGFRIEKK